MEGLNTIWKALESEPTLLVLLAVIVLFLRHFGKECDRRAERDEADAESRKAQAEANVKVAEALGALRADLEK